MKTNKKLAQLHKLYQDTPKQLVGILAISVVTIATSAVTLAWGPDRTTYTVEKPADHVTFNSITNNPMYGDERNFFRIKEATAPNSSYSDNTKLEPGKDYIGYVYFHNNASSTLNDEAHGFKGIAENTKLRMAIPGGVKAGEKAGLTGYISASNAQPGEVYDDAFITSDVDVALRYIPGSAQIASKGAVNGQTLPDSVVTTGSLLGYDSLNGKLPGCDEFSGYVTFKFRADAPNFTIKKQVSKHGENKWQDKIVAKLGDKVDYMLTYQNTGSVDQNKVLIKDQLPSGVTYVPGSSILANSVNPNGVKTDDGVTVGGLNIGSYKPRGNAGVKFSATIASNLEKCGPNDLVNTATVITDNGKKSATATVTVDQVCQPNECKPGIPEGDARCATPIKECEPGTVKDDAGNCTVAPTSLPTTGPTEVILSIIGLGALAAGIAYWVKSRRELQDAIAVAASNAKTEDAPKLLTSRTATKSSDDKKDF